MYSSDFFEGRIWFGMLKKLVNCLQVARVHMLTNEDTIQVLTQSTRPPLGLSRIPRDNAKGILKRENLFLWTLYKHKKNLNNSGIYGRDSWE